MEQETEIYISYSDGTKRCYELKEGDAIELFGDEIQIELVKAGDGIIQ